MPLALAGRGVEADERLAEQAVAESSAAVVIVARRRYRHVEKAAPIVERHRRPHVDVSGERPRVVFPRVVAELAGLRNRVERPHGLAGPRVEAADVARRIVPIAQSVADAVADD